VETDLGTLCSQSPNADNLPLTRGAGSYPLVLVDEALVFFGDPHAAISEGIITSGIECSMNVRARVTLLKDRVLERPIIARAGQCISSELGRMSRKQPKTPLAGLVDFAVARTGSVGRRLTCCCASSASCGSAPHRVRHGHKADRPNSICRDG
jgi:hypothetical protein